ncbi:MAG: bifunctional 3-deoxy-7-phosphoheptulonate synthase/chorismate mutase type II [Bacteroidales bacterium]|nr:bifunctional 3-deoxy-7-phosphoheptulonate synthase/chorismate mutase type II [Bacteroidales bacterium]
MTNISTIEDWFSSRSGLLIAAGPCSVESRSQMLNIAEALRGKVSIIRGGIWKPRTRPSAFEGIGEKGLEWLREAGETAGLPTMTEIATPRHLEAALEHKIDAVWIGARTVVNPFSVQELAEAMRGIQIPVFVKNPVSMDVKLWLGAIERFETVGITRVAAIHRGFPDNDINYRNAPHWEIPIELHRLRPDINIITDISHICGRRDILTETAQKALDLATDGLMIETHCNPEDAATDAEQQITPSALEEMMNVLIVKKDISEEEKIISELRSRIDIIDDELLRLFAKRMNISEEIGRYKKLHGITVLQMGRWEKILNDYLKKAEKLGLSNEFVKAVFEQIHKESIEKQLEDRR